MNHDKKCDTWSGYTFSVKHNHFKLYAKNKVSARASNIFVVVFLRQNSEKPVCSFVCKQWIFLRAIHDIRLQCWKYPVETILMLAHFWWRKIYNASTWTECKSAVFSHLFRLCIFIREKRPKKKLELPKVVVRFLSDICKRKLNGCIGIQRFFILLNQ